MNDFCVCTEKNKPILVGYSSTYSSRTGKTCMTLGKTKEKRRGTGCITEYHGTEIKTEDKGGY